MYGVTFLGKPDYLPHFVPYISSFCSHATDDQYAKSNGLLSQWRAYGDPDDGRFAVVFDTRGLHEMLSTESSLHAFSSLKFAPVIYETEGFDFSSRFPLLVAELNRHHGLLYDPAEPDLSDSQLLEEFLTVSTLLKHRAFSEEREVRIVSIPLTEDLRADMLKKTGVDEAAGKLLEPIKHRAGKGFDIPYLALFESLSSSLPIRRIVVGPSRDQNAAVTEARRIAGSRIPVLVSSIPLQD